jgi:hypothetical protein
MYCLFNCKLWALQITINSFIDMSCEMFHINVFSPTFNPCECGRDYIGETGRPLGVRSKEHKYNLNEGHFHKPKLALHASTL